MLILFLNILIIALCSAQLAVGMHAMQQAPALPPRPHGTTSSLACQKYKPGFPLDSALVSGNPHDLIEYYSNWQGTYSQAEYTAHIVDSLRQAAQLPQKTIGPVIPFLLARIDPSNLDDIVCLFKDAQDNGHHDLAQYILAQFASKLDSVRFALIIAIDSELPIRVETLLRAGVSPDEELSGTKNFPLHRATARGNGTIVDLLLKYNASATRLDGTKKLPISAALHGFDPNDSESKITERLYIVKRLLEEMPKAERPIAIEANLCKIPTTTRTRLAEILDTFQTTPARLCMTEEYQPKLKDSGADLETVIICANAGIVLCVTIGACIIKALSEKKGKIKDKPSKPTYPAQFRKYKVYEPDGRRRK